MRSLLLLAALIPASLTLLPGCPLACGSWEGRGDTMYRSDKGESVMLCANGGYAATLTSGIVEGVFEWSDEIRGSNPETGARAFTMVTNADGTATSTELPGVWTQATLDKVELDHAHVQCSDLETRAWWGTVYTTAYLPKAAAFKKPAAGFVSADACFEAQARGDYPEAALCEDELLACPDGTVKINQGQSIDAGTYDAQFGTLHVRPTFSSAFDGVFAQAGTLTTHVAYDTTAPKSTWRQVPVAEMSNGAACH